jgi:NADH-quinone oxidoreductase subunit L
MILEAWLVWVIPLAGAALAPVVGRASRGLLGWFAVAVSGLALADSVLLAAAFQAPSLESAGSWLPPLGVTIQVQVDGLSVLTSVFVSFLSFLVVVYSLGYMKERDALPRYYGLVLLFVGGMLGLVMAGNLIQFYFFWEVVGVCSAFLIAFWRDREPARKAGMKAFLVTRLGDASLLIAILLLVTLAGSTTFSFLLSPLGIPALGSGTVQLVGILILIGAMGKSAQVPLHVWLPDAMEGPTTVSALIHAATMVNAGVFLLLRMFPLFDSSGFLLLLVLLVGLTTAGLGAVSALAAEDMKRMLAYSTISQLGLMFAAIGLGSYLGATFHMVSQGVFKALAFLAAGSVTEAVGTRDMRVMGGLKNAMKYTYASFLLAMLAMAGLPPLIGFWTKDAILAVAFSTNIYAWALIAGVSVLTAAYGLRAVFKVFHGAPAKPELPSESPPSMVVPMVVLCVGVVVGWFVLAAQSFVPTGGVELPAAPTLITSLFALTLGAGAAYSAFSRREAVALFFQKSGSLSALRSFLLEGRGVDRLYGFLAGRVVMGLAGLAGKLQTGLLSANVALLLLAALVMLLLVAGGAV